MASLTLKQKILALIALVGAILIFIFQQGLYGKEEAPKPRENLSQPTPTITIDSGAQPQVVSSNPNPLDEAVILPTQDLEITFSQPAVNGPELKIRTDPPANLKIDLSDDRKTVRLIPLKPFELGKVYTVTIPREAKFEGGKTLGQDITYHFRTIEYKGI